MKDPISPEPLRRTASLVAAAICLLCLSGCGLLYHGPMIDTVETEDGVLMLADTLKMWSRWTSLVDDRVSREVSGDSPPMGKDTWIEFWQQHINGIMSNGRRQNPRKYVKYIIETREAADLPALAVELQ